MHSGEIMVEISKKILVLLPPIQCLSFAIMSQHTHVRKFFQLGKKVGRKES